MTEWLMGELVYSRFALMGEEIRSHNDKRHICKTKVHPRVYYTYVYVRMFMRHVAGAGNYLIAKDVADANQAAARTSLSYGAGISVTCLPD